MQPWVTMRPSYFHLAEGVGGEGCSCWFSPARFGQGIAKRSLQCVVLGSEGLEEVASGRSRNRL